jgi:hypothetical protein
MPAAAGARASIKARTEIVSSISTQPSTEGPMMMPATISKTTEGSRTRGKSPSRKGAPKPTATTISKPLNPGSFMRPQSGVRP